MTPRRPLLYLDVDGPLNPYAAKPERRPVGYTTHRMKPQGWLDQHPGEFPEYVRPLRVWLNPDHGRRLLELGELFDLVWATTWGPEANTYIGPVIGLPELPVVHWPETRGDVRGGERGDARAGANPGPSRPSRPSRPSGSGLFWKTPHLVEYAADRPFAWVDDELGAADRAFVATHHGGSALLHHVDPRLGLLDPDFATLAAFARECRTDGGAAVGE